MKDDPAIGLMRTEGADLGVDVLAEYEVGLPIVPLKCRRFGGLVGVPLFFLPVCVFMLQMANFALCSL